MKYNRPHATANWGPMARDWERGIDYQRLIRERFERAQAAVKAACLGGVLCFNVDNVRYITGTHIGEWVRDKFDRYALCPRDGEPYLWNPVRRPPSASAVPGSPTVSAHRSATCRARCRPR
ncbi:MAG: hypothetical protein A3E79_18725 [Burkholderiales bacterium RIFCSPHIGHO2_12_FULL_61_11]|nr:MAG: hypothetical protein A3E79_18725 [Burkholderiales bacterium RIFCSPHIGHO2_12_FULL_61_11]